MEGWFCYNILCQMTDLGENGAFELPDPRQQPAHWVDEDVAL